MGSGESLGGERRDSDRSRQASGRFQDESGSILVLFSIFLTLFLLCCAIVIDVGYWWANAKSAQNAADACALAAAGELPKTYADDPDCVIEEVGGPDYVLANLPDQTSSGEGAVHLSTRVRSPYNGDTSLVEATVRMRVKTFFGRIVGLDSIELTRRAVAERLEGDGDYAIYSHSGGCPEDGDGESLIFNGNNHWINGRVHSNGQYLVNNGGPEPFWAKVGTRVDCVSLQPPGAVRFGGDGWSTGQTKPDTVLPQNWPEFWTPDEFGWPTCSGANFAGQKIEIDETYLKVTGRPDILLPVIDGRRTIPPGIYCGTELFKISGNHLVGNITALAPKIEIAGNNLDLSAFASDVLLFAVPNWHPGWVADTDTGNDGAPDGLGPLTCSGTIEMNLVNGNDGAWMGKVFHPCHRVIVNGNDASSIEGAIYAYEVRVNGNGFNMVGNGGGAGLRDTALVE